jgi:hypothetical protein
MGLVGNQIGPMATQKKMSLSMVSLIIQLFLELLKKAPTNMAATVSPE